MQYDDYKAFAILRNTQIWPTVKRILKEREIKYITSLLKTEGTECYRLQGRITELKEILDLFDKSGDKIKEMDDRKNSVNPNQRF